MRFIFLLFFAFASSTSQARVIGSDDLSSLNSGALNLPPMVRQAVDTIGLISTACTGTHIGSNLVITAAHCFSFNFLPLSFNISCPDITIQWGVRGDRRGLISQCLRIVALEYNQTSDWAVFEVNRAPRAYTQVHLEKLSADARLTILSHPKNRPLEWSKYCRHIPYFAKSFVPKSFNHQCDTEPGSSGAPIFSAQDMSLVGIHNGGQASLNGIGFINFGTYIIDIPWNQVIAKGRIRGPLKPLPGSFGN